MPRLIAPAMASGLFSGSDHPELSVGPDVVLRAWRTADSAAVLEAFADPEIQRWHVRRADSVEEAAEWIAARQRGWAAETELNWALAEQRTGMLLGRMTLGGVDLCDGSAGLAYWMVPAARGRGLCTQAAQVLCRWAFDDAGFHRIGLEHSTANHGSCRVAVKAGFLAEGIRRGSALHADGWHDMHVHSRLATDVHAF
ncbi:GNAT family N-acetyltransferase [Mycolicibacterium sp. YH-1]|uniref:GNAT family N-acetyltransferase n=1 Tax=Mycolicibacterium sp. YH-1 TaxID=2908837 RepID=UPI001F4C1E60|nr:GNAT family N-acetyltransferase [Mycolicibacterium sp. YH-1]UNB52918.1 GNAT family N-acetyltransferase [Mycolicibacterium sp. YH-1]